MGRKGNKQRPQKPEAAEEAAAPEAAAAPRPAATVAKAVASKEFTLPLLGAGPDGELVSAVAFEGVAPERLPETKALLLELLTAAGPWQRTIATVVVPKHNVGLSCVEAADGKLLAAHLTLHNDFKLVKLGRDYGFPRGFCIVADRQARRLLGLGAFYPKFANDDRNSGFSAKDFGGIDRISCFLKYSGSTGLVTLLYDAEGHILGWTGSSKNSCNHAAREGGISYAREVSRVFAPLATRRFLRWCEEKEILSLGLEVCLVGDQVHGYGYRRDGCVVTCMARRHHAGQPVYLSPSELFEHCREAGLPTDRPIVVQGVAEVQSFVSSLCAARDVLTLPLLRRVLAEQLVDLETIHEDLIDSDIIEGFVVRRWKSGVEVESVKFKIWLYQMVTQVLRPWIAQKKFDRSSEASRSLRDATGHTKEQLLGSARKEMQKWCTDSAAKMRHLCLWLIHSAARACPPEGSDALPEGCLAPRADRAYWVLLGERAVHELSVLLAKANWDPQLAASLVADHAPGTLWMQQAIEEPAKVARSEEPADAPAEKPAEKPADDGLEFLRALRGGTEGEHSSALRMYAGGAGVARFC